MNVLHRDVRDVNDHVNVEHTVEIHVIIHQSTRVVLKNRCRFGFYSSVFLRGFWSRTLIVAFLEIGLLLF
jgi:hypothetical protein